MNIKNILISIWPTVRKAISEILYFLLDLIKSFVKTAKEEITQY